MVLMVPILTGIKEAAHPNGYNELFHCFKKEAVKLVLAKIIVLK